MSENEINNNKKNQNGAESGSEAMHRMFTPSISIRVTLGLFVALLVILIFTVTMNLAAAIHMDMEVNGNIEGDYTVGQTVQVAMGEEQVRNIFEQGRRIYESIPEEIREDRISQKYLSNFNELQTDEYAKILETLQKVDEIFGYLWVDLRIYDTENDRVIFLMDTSPESDGKFTAGYWESLAETADQYTVEVKDGVVEGYADGGEFEEELYNELNNLITTFRVDVDQFCTLVPYNDPDTGEIVGYLAFGEDVAVYHKHRQIFAAIYFVVMMVILIIVLLITSVYINLLFVRPVRRLSKAAREYVTDNKVGREKGFFEKVPIKTHDELRVLRNSMSFMEEEIGSYLTHITAMTAEKERVAAELDVAARIQLNMLPVALEGYEGVKNFEISSIISPAKEVGGDFYDYYPIDDDHICICIADVSGKGIPAALFGVVVKILLKDNSDLESPDEIVSAVNNKLCGNNGEMMFVTVWFGILTVSTGRLDYINAGHEHPAVYRQDTGKFELVLEKHDIVLGFMTDVTFTHRTLQLNPGDKLYLYTDGVPEAINSSDEMYGTDRMLQSLSAHSDNAGEDLLAHVREDVDAFVGDAPQFDDITMVLLEYGRNADA